MKNRIVSILSLALLVLFCLVISVHPLGTVVNLLVLPLFTAIPVASRKLKWLFIPGIITVANSLFMGFLKSFLLGGASFAQGLQQTVGGCIVLNLALDLVLVAMGAVAGMIAGAVLHTNANYALKALAFVAVLTIVCAPLGYVVNAFTGNPISAFAAKGKIVAQIKADYPNAEYDVPTPKYDLKAGYYSEVTINGEKHNYVYSVVNKTVSVVG